MKKFFRTIRQKLMTEGNLRKYLLYAIGEILLVMFGILLALQVNNWNESRKNKIKEKEILEDLHKNIVLNNELMIYNLSFLDNLDASSDILLKVLENNQPYSDTLNIHFSNAKKHGFLNFMLSRSGFEVYRNTGFEIIQNKQLKEEIIDLFEVTYSKLERVHSYLESESKLTRELVYNYYFMVDKGSMYPFNYDRFLKEKKYKSLLIRIRANRGLLKDNIQDCLTESKEVLKHIKYELEEPE